MKVLIVDDHEYTRAGVIRILTDNFPITKFAQAGNYEDAVEQVKNGKWDTIILDINLPGRGGFEVLNSIRMIKPKIPVLILSMVPVSQYVRRVFNAGVPGYITKSEPAEEMVKAFRRVSKGLKYFSPEVQQEIPVVTDESVERPKFHDLTDREFAILQMVGEGKSSKEIACKYKLSVNTINSHRKRIMKKINARTNLELLKYAYEHRIVE